MHVNITKLKDKFGQDINMPFFGSAVSSTAWSEILGLLIVEISLMGSLSMVNNWFCIPGVAVAVRAITGTVGKYDLISNR